MDGYLGANSGGGAGGGFVHSGFYGGGGAVAAPNDRRNSLVPVRVADLTHAVQDAHDERFRIYDNGEVPIDNVKVVARVADFREQAADTVWLLEDATASLWARFSGGSTADAKNDAEAAERAATERVGTLVRAFGQLKELDGDRKLNLQMIRSASGGEAEMRYHDAQCRLTRLQLTRGYVRGGSGGGGGGGSGIGNGYGAAAAAATAGAGYHQAGGQLPVQQRVMQAIIDESKQNGNHVVTVSYLAGVLGMDPKQVREACQRLNDEGHVFSPNDDDSYTWSGGVM